MTPHKHGSFGLAEILSAKDLAQLLLSILSFLFGFLLLGSFSYLIDPSTVNAMIARNSLIMAGITMFSIFLVRKKRFSLAVLVILIACGAVLFWAAWNGAGIRGPAFIVCSLLVLGAAMYWGRRAGLIAASIVGLAGLLLILASRAGWLANLASPVADWFMWAALFSNSILFALMTGIMLEYVEKLLSQVRSLNAELEQRVIERTAKLAESERLLKIISENVRDVIWIVDLQLTTTYSTASAARLRGFSMEELSNEPLQKAITPESFAQAMQIFQEEMEMEVRGDADPNRSRIMHFDYYRKDGSTVPVEVNASFLRDEQGQPIGLTGVSRDISERHWMEKALIESEERYRKISSVISDFSFSSKVDAQGNFLPEWVAGAFAEITGYKFDEYLACGGWENLLHPDSYTQDALDRKAMFSNRQVDGSVLKFRRKDGEICWVRNFVHPIWNKKENRLTGVYGGVQDITAEKQATERLRALNDELEAHVAERTARLENALGELESFSYSISHDLRAPLRAVNGYAGMLLAERGQDFPSDVIEKLNVIKENGQRMGQLVDGLLQFLQSGREQIVRQSLDPREIVRDVLDHLRPQYENRRVEIVIDDLPPCSANLRLLSKVYEGLLSNAIKFTRNRADARIEIGALEQDDRQVYFVRDNGVGFDMKYYDKLFGVFQRLHHLSEFEGIGASLAIINRIINRHGGRIWAEAEVDQGATFYFTIG